MVLDLKEANGLLAKIPPGVNQKGIEHILAEILEVRPDVTMAEFEDRLQAMLTSKNIRSWSGFFVREFADSFRGEAFEQVRQRLQAAVAATKAATAAAAIKAAAVAAEEAEFESWLERWMSEHPNENGIDFKDIPKRFWKLAEEREQELQRKAAQA